MNTKEIIGTTTIYWIIVIVLNTHFCGQMWLHILVMILWTTLATGFTLSVWERWEDKYWWCVAYYAVILTYNLDNIYGYI